ncbi:iron uptake transporter deferrochelatase/peroxidase subunit [Paenibacillus sp. N1-5-1-14]|uniref:iron uptake transporter deferrochelatase/peroxidase subunit n=1 Tax=Paenibacillus radicibacter TaxID=2972488 RepID=UPI0021591116|nr:iron uptake transporter deferrochelatase/peroxidase subunit [Paenibacillus radicibacter]MCR8645389.1 iron uptake transporter deferrochelatase/peroxidase subunit [Paenibacillus radicibacter]
MTKDLSRRKFIGMAVTGAAGLVIGNMMDWPKRIQGVIDTTPDSEANVTTSDTNSKTAPETEPFLGFHQAGIVTPAQQFLNITAFDLLTKDQKDVKELLKTWTKMIARITTGKPPSDQSQNVKFPPLDTGEEVGLDPAKLTITIGFGASLFDKLGLASKKPKGLESMPIFHLDALKEPLTHGDIVVKACADDPVVCFHAIRNLSIASSGIAHMRWQHTGQSGTKPEGTPRNLFGFKDGTNNPRFNDEAFMNNNVWLNGNDVPSWLVGGTYMVVRRIQMRIETWDQLSYTTQEETIGRQKVTGAPMDGIREHDEPNFKQDGQGKVTPLDSHIRLSNPRTGEQSERERILRRGYNFMDGLDEVGRMNAGLMFICFNRNMKTQFESIQNRLANAKKIDQLMKYTQTVGGGYFVVPPGVKNASSYIGEGLFG